jgi:branched-chain amino acid transport system ATP-binding protein
MLLKVDDIRVHYEKVEAVKGVSLEVFSGDIVTLIGSNGAGKTTILRTISGLKTTTSGEIYFKDKRIDRESPANIVKMGVAHVPEGRGMFPYMSVVDNLKMGAYKRTDGREEIEKDIEEVYKHFPSLKERTRQAAGTLSGGEQQMVAIGRAIMARPSLLLLDEPSLGLSPLMVEEISEIIKNLNTTLGVTTILVEQNASMALSLADRGYVLEVGKVILQGTTQELKESERVKRAYLGI